MTQKITLKIMIHAFIDEQIEWVNPMWAHPWVKKVLTVTANRT